MKKNIINREISWLAFNKRVLQEAQSRDVPLIEKLRFLGIYCRNKDEFLRVRVAIVKKVVVMTQIKNKLLSNPSLILKKIQKILAQQEREFQSTYTELVKSLEKEQVFIKNPKQLLPEQINFLKIFFYEKVLSSLGILLINKKTQFNLSEEFLYLLVITSEPKENPLALISFSQNLNRFIEVPSKEEKIIVLIDDLIKFFIKDIFPFSNDKKINAYCFKLIQDAELDVSEFVLSSSMQAIEESLQKRKASEFVSLSYEYKFPQASLDYLIRKIKLDKTITISRSKRYLNFKDFINFPSIGKKSLYYKSITQAQYPLFKQTDKSHLEILQKKEALIFYPYQKFYHTIEILREAAIHPDVQSIFINLYRIAKDSKIATSLINATKNGKKVLVFIELRARFDEEHNIFWAKKLEDEGIKVISNIAKLKVHSKAILITFKKNKGLKNICHIGSGNFNESTSKVYTDIAFWTHNEKITNEIHKLFEFFKAPYLRGHFSFLIVCPFNGRRKFFSLIDQEIKNAKMNKPAFIYAKMNALTDQKIIKRLYRASKAGVKIKLLIRGSCSIIPGNEDYNKNIEAISIIAHLLEHSRLFIFCNNNDSLYFIGSGDWMKRNFDYRIEVFTPIHDKNFQKDLDFMFHKAFEDNTKARIHDKELTNNYRKSQAKNKVNYQNHAFQYFKQKEEDNNL